MYTFFVTLIVISALLVIGLVLVQESKGGGLSSQVGDVYQYLDVRRTTSFLEKSTWVMAGIIVLLSIVCAALLS